MTQPSISQHIPASPAVPQHLMACPSISQRVMAHPSISQHGPASPGMSQHVMAHPSMSQYVPVPLDTSQHLPGVPRRLPTAQQCPVGPQDSSRPQFRYGVQGTWLLFGWLMTPQTLAALRPVGAVLSPVPRVCGTTRPPAADSNHQLRKVSRNWPQTWVIFSAGLELSHECEVRGTRTHNFPCRSFPN